MKSKQSKKSYKKAPAAKKKRPVSKKSAPKKAAKKAPSNGKKNSGVNYKRKPIESWAADLAEEVYDQARELMEKGANPKTLRATILQSSAEAQKTHVVMKRPWSIVFDLINRGWPKQDIQVIIRYRTAGGIVEYRGLRELQDERGVK